MNGQLGEIFFGAERKKGRPMAAPTIVFNLQAGFPFPSREIVVRARIVRPCEWFALIFIVAEYNPVCTIFLVGCADLGTPFVNSSALTEPQGRSSAARIIVKWAWEATGLPYGYASANGNISFQIACAGGFRYRTTCSSLRIGRGA